MRFGTRPYRLILLCLVLLAAAVVWIKRPWPELRPCNPTFWEIAEGESIEVRVGARRFGIRAALIGCEADLRQLDRRQGELIRSVIEEMLRTETWQAWPKSRERGFRLALADEINALLGRPVVRDVHLYSFSAIE
jgi:hypothetical protein